MVLTLTPEALLFAAGLFTVRVFNVAIATVRLIILSRQKRLLASAMGFFEVLIFALTVGVVVNDLGNLLNLFAYCFGFAVGTYIGMIIEERFVTSYSAINIITGIKGHDIALALREAGYGVTESTGEGRDGMVTMLRSMVVARDVKRVMQIAREVQPEAFISVEAARPLQRGYWRGVRPQP